MVCDGLKSDQFLTIIKGFLVEVTVNYFSFVITASHSVVFNFPIPLLMTWPHTGSLQDTHFLPASCLLWGDKGAGMKEENVTIRPAAW